MELRGATTIAACGFAQVIRDAPEIFKVFVVFIDPQDVAAGQNTVDLESIASQEIPEIPEESSAIDVARSKFQGEGTNRPAGKTARPSSECRQLGTFNIEFCEVHELDALGFECGIQGCHRNRNLLLWPRCKKSFPALIE